MAFWVSDTTHFVHPKLILANLNSVFHPIAFLLFRQIFFWEIKIHFSCSWDMWNRKKLSANLFLGKLWLWIENFGFELKYCEELKRVLANLIFDHTEDFFYILKYLQSLNPLQHSFRKDRPNFFEAGATFDNSFFDNSFVLVRQLKNS